MFALAKDPTGKVYSLLNPDGSVNEIAVESAATHVANDAFLRQVRLHRQFPTVHRSVSFAEYKANCWRNERARAEHQRWQWQVAHGDFWTSVFVSAATGASLATDGPMEAA